jgi:hypothetical protein
MSVAFLSNFSKGCIGKALIELLTKRNPIKVWKFSKDEIFRFGTVLGLTALTFSSVMCFLRRVGKWQGNQFAFRINSRQAYVIAAMIASLAMSHGLPENGQNLLKLVFYPLASRCFFNKLFELGYLKSFPGGDILAYLISSWLVTFTYTMERHGLPNALHKMVDTWAHKTARED